MSLQLVPNNNSVAWNYLIQSYTEKRAAGVAKKNSFPSILLVAKSRGYQGKQCNLSLKITELPLELFEQQEVPMGRCEQ